MHIAQSTLWSDIYDCGFLHCSSFPSECQFNCKQMYFVDYFVGKWNHLDIICLVCSADRDRKCLPFSKLYRHFKLVNPGSAPRQENNELFPILWASVTWLNDSLCWLTVLFRLTFDPHQWTAHSLFKWPVPSNNEGVTATNSQRFLRNSVKRWGVSHRKQVELQHDGCPTSCLIHIIIPYSHGN